MMFAHQAKANANVALQATEPSSSSTSSSRESVTQAQRQSADVVEIRDAVMLHEMLDIEREMRGNARGKLVNVE